MGYGNFKDLTRRTASDKILCDKAFNDAKNPETMNVHVDLLQWFIRKFKKSKEYTPLSTIFGVLTSQICN